MNEATRRSVNLKYDNQPSYHHLFNAKFALPYIRNKKVLDIGCWTGQFEKLVVTKTKSIVGLDPGKNAVKTAKKMVPDAKFKIGNALKLPFNKNAFESVTLFDVIEHIPKDTEPQCLSEIRRVLSPKGYLIISTPSSAFLSIVLDPAYFIIGHRHYSLQSLQKLLKNSGFTIKKISYTGGVFTMCSGIIQSLYKHILGKKFIIPDWYQKKIDDEYTKDGFTEIHIIAKVADSKN